MYGRVIEHVNNFKFLGCNIDSVLNWHIHCNHVCKKVAQGIALLKSVHNLYPTYCKRMLYFAFIYSNLTYCLAIWGNAPMLYINRVLLLQKKAIRLLFSAPWNYHVNPLAYNGNLLLLQELYESHLALFLFRCCTLRCNIDLFESGGFVPLCVLHAHPRTRNVQFNYFVPYARTSLRKNAVLHQCVRVWNALPVELKCANSLALLKKQLFGLLLGRYADVY